MKILVLTTVCLIPLFVNSAFAQTQENNFELSQNIYTYGDTIVIHGTAESGISKVNIQIFYQNDLSDIAQIKTTDDHTFTHTIDAIGPLWNNSGEYLVRVIYGPGVVIEKSFELKAAFSQNPTISADQRHYESGDIISISGQLSDFPNSEIEVYISETRYDNGGYGFNKLWSEKITTDDNGEFSTLTIAGMNGNWIPSEHMRLSMANPDNQRVATYDFSFGNPEEFEAVVFKDLISIQLDSKIFELRTQTENLKILDASVDTAHRSIVFDIEMQEPQGIFEVWLDTNLIDAKSGDLDEEFIILADDDEKKYAEIFYRDKDLRVVSVWLSGDVKTIEIIGTQFGEQSSESEIPEWVRTVFKFWADGQISDQELKEAIRFLVNSGIIIL